MFEGSVTLNITVYDQATRDALWEKMQKFVGELTTPNKTLQLSSQDIELSTEGTENFVNLRA